MYCNCTERLTRQLCSTIFDTAPLYQSTYQHFPSRSSYLFVVSVGILCTSYILVPGTRYREVLLCNGTYLVIHMYIYMIYILPVLYPVATVVYVNIVKPTEKKSAKFSIFRPTTIPACVHKRSSTRILLIHRQTLNTCFHHGKLHMASVRATVGVNETTGRAMDSENGVIFDAHQCRPWRIAFVPDD